MYFIYTPTQGFKKNETALPREGTESYEKHVGIALWTVYSLYNYDVL